MKDLNFPVSGNNFGGVDRFWFTPAENIAGEDDLGMVILKPGTYWFLGRATKYTLELNNPTKVTRAGTIWEPNLSGLISKITPELEEVLQLMYKLERFVLIYKDKNGYLTQIGTSEQSLTFTTDSGTGDTPISKNGVNFSFKGKVKKAPVPYTREIITGGGDSTPKPTGDPVTIKINGNTIIQAPAGSTFEIYSEFTLEYKLKQ
jgi:hypothetical protein